MPKKPYGLTLIEVIVSLIVLGVVGAALVGLALTSLRGTNSGKLRSVATQYAREGIEGVRAIRDEQGWTDFSSYAGPYYLSRTGSGFSLSTDAAVGSLGNGYSRSLTITNLTADKKKITVNVSYTENGQSRNVILTSYLANWQ